MDPKLQYFLDCTGWTTDDLVQKLTQSILSEKSTDSEEEKSANKNTDKGNASVVTKKSRKQTVAATIPKKFSNTDVITLSDDSSAEEDCSKDADKLKHATTNSAQRINTPSNGNSRFPSSYCEWKQFYSRKVSEDKNKLPERYNDRENPAEKRKKEMQLVITTLEGIIRAATANINQRKNNCPAGNVPAVTQNDVFLQQTIGNILTKVPIHRKSDSNKVINTTPISLISPPLPVAPPLPISPPPPLLPLPVPPALPISLRPYLQIPVPPPPPVRQLPPPPPLPSSLRTFVIPSIPAPSLDYKSSVVPGPTRPHNKVNVATPPLVPVIKSEDKVLQIANKLKQELLELKSKVNDFSLPYNNPDNFSASKSSLSGIPAKQPSSKNQLKNEIKQNSNDELKHKYREWRHMLDSTDNKFKITLKKKPKEKIVPIKQKPDKISLVPLSKLMDTPKEMSLSTEKTSKEEESKIIEIQDGPLIKTSTFGTIVTNSSYLNDGGENSSNPDLDFLLKIKEKMLKKSANRIDLTKSPDDSEKQEFDRVSVDSLENYLLETNDIEEVSNNTQIPSTSFNKQIKEECRVVVTNAVSNDEHVVTVDQENPKTLNSSEKLESNNFKESGINGLQNYLEEISDIEINVDKIIDTGGKIITECNNKNEHNINVTTNPVKRKRIRKKRKKISTAKTLNLLASKEIIDVSNKNTTVKKKRKRYRKNKKHLHNRNNDRALNENQISIQTNCKLIDREVQCNSVQNGDITNNDVITYLDSMAKKCVNESVPNNVTVMDENLITIRKNEHLSDQEVQYDITDNEIVKENVDEKCIVKNTANITKSDSLQYGNNTTNIVENPNKNSDLSNIDSTNNTLNNISKNTDENQPPNIMNNNSGTELSIFNFTDKTENNVSNNIDVKKLSNNSTNVVESENKNYDSEISIKDRIDKIKSNDKNEINEIPPLSSLVENENNNYHELSMIVNNIKNNDTELIDSTDKIKSNVSVTNNMEVKQPVNNITNIAEYEHKNLETEQNIIDSTDKIESDVTNNSDEIQISNSKLPEVIKNFASLNDVVIVDLCDSDENEDNGDYVKCVSKPYDNIVDKLRETALSKKIEPQSNIMCELDVIDLTSNSDNKIITIDCSPLSSNEIPDNVSTVALETPQIICKSTITDDHDNNSELATSPKNKIDDIDTPTIHESDKELSLISRDSLVEISKDVIPKINSQEKNDGNVHTYHHSHNIEENNVDSINESDKTSLDVKKVLEDNTNDYHTDSFKQDTKVIESYNQNDEHNVNNDSNEGLFLPDNKMMEREIACEKDTHNIIASKILSDTSNITIADNDNVISDIDRELDTYSSVALEDKNTDSVIKCCEKSNDSNDSIYFNYDHAFGDMSDISDSFEISDNEYLDDKSEDDLTRGIGGSSGNDCSAKTNDIVENVLQKHASNTPLDISVEPIKEKEGVLPVDISDVSGNEKDFAVGELSVIDGESNILDNVNKTIATESDYLDSVSCETSCDKLNHFLVDKTVVSIDNQFNLDDEMKTDITVNTLIEGDGLLADGVPEKITGNIPEAKQQNIENERTDVIDSKRQLKKNMTTNVNNIVLKEYKDDISTETFPGISLVATTQQENNDTESVIDKSTQEIMNTSKVNTVLTHCTSDSTLNITTEEDNRKATENNDNENVRSKIMAQLALLRNKKNDQTFTKFTGTNLTNTFKKKPVLKEQLSVETSAAPEEKITETIPSENTITINKHLTSKSISVTKTDDYTKIKGWKNKLLEIKRVEVQDEGLEDIDWAIPSCSFHELDFKQIHKDKSNIDDIIESVICSNAKGNECDYEENTNGYLSTDTVDGDIDYSDIVYPGSVTSEINSEESDSQADDFEIDDDEKNNSLKEDTPKENSSNTAITNNAFCSTDLDGFLTESAGLEISYPVPELLMGPALVLVDESTEHQRKEIRDESVESPDKREESPKEIISWKPRTLAEKRRMLDVGEPLVKRKKIVDEPVEDSLLEKVSEDYFNLPDIPIKHIYKQSKVFYNDEVLIVPCKRKRKIYIEEVLPEKPDVVEIPVQQEIVKPPPIWIPSKSYKITDSKDVAVVKYRPGPLSKKKLAYSGNWKCVVKDLPNVNITITPRYLKPISHRALQFYVMTEGCDLTSNRVNFALSALRGSEPKSITLPVQYANNQKQILLREKVIEPNNLTRNDENDSDVDECIVNVMNDILDYIDIKEAEEPINMDDDFITRQESSPSKQIVEKKRKGAKRANHAIKSNKMNRFLIRQLKNLQVKVIDVNIEDNSNEPCSKEYCKLGCVCRSLANKLPTSEHCRKISCMLDCSCGYKKPIYNSRLNLPRGSDIHLSSTMRGLQNEVTKDLAKVERQFAQTVIRTNNETFVIGDTSERKRRPTKLPKRFDCFIDVSEGIQTGTLFDMSEPTVTVAEPYQILLDPKIKRSVVKVEKLDLQHVVPFCLDHARYDCHCYVDVAPDNTVSTDLSDKPVKSKTQSNTKQTKTTMSKTIKNTSLQNNVYNIAEKKMPTKSSFTSVIPSNLHENQFYNMSNKMDPLRKHYGPANEKKHFIKIGPGTKDKDYIGSFMNKMKNRSLINTKSISDSLLNALDDVTKMDRSVKFTTENSTLTEKSATLSLVNESLTSTLEKEILTKISPEEREHTPKLECNNEDSYITFSEDKHATSRRKQKLSAKPVEVVEILDDSDSDSELPENEFVDKMIGIFLAPTDTVRKQFLGLLGKDTHATDQFKLLPFPDLLQYFNSNKLYIWCSPSNSSPTFLITVRNKRPTNAFMNIKFIRDLNHQNVSPFIHWLITGVVPADKVAEELLVIMTLNKTFYEICGICEKKQIGAYKTPLVQVSNGIKKTIRQPQGQLVRNNTRGNEKRTIQLPNNKNVEVNLQFEAYPVVGKFKDVQLYGEIGAIRVSLPPITDVQKWFMVSLKRKFSLLKFSRSNYSLSYNILLSMSNKAMETNSTVFIRDKWMLDRANSQTTFGIYTTPNIRKCLFIGPYYVASPIDLELFCKENNIYVTLDIYYKRTEPKPAGIWMVQLDARKQTTANPAAVAPLNNTTQTSILKNQVQITKVTKTVPSGIIARTSLLKPSQREIPNLVKISDFLQPTSNGASASTKMTISNNAVVPSNAVIPASDLEMVGNDFREAQFKNSSGKTVHYFSTNMPELGYIRVYHCLTTKAYYIMWKAIKICKSLLEARQLVKQILQQTVIFVPEYLPFDIHVDKSPPEGLNIFDSKYFLDSYIVGTFGVHRLTDLDLIKLQQSCGYTDTDIDHIKTRYAKLTLKQCYNIASTFLTREDLLTIRNWADMTRIVKMKIKEEQDKECNMSNIRLRLKEHQNELLIRRANIVDALRAKNSLRVVKRPIPVITSGDSIVVPTKKFKLIPSVPNIRKNIILEKKILANSAITTTTFKRQTIPVVNTSSGLSGPQYQPPPSFGIPKTFIIKPQKKVLIKNDGSIIKVLPTQPKDSCNKDSLFVNTKQSTTDSSASKTGQL